MHLDHTAGEPITALAARDVVLLADAPALTITCQRVSAGLAKFRFTVPVTKAS